MLLFVHGFRAKVFTELFFIMSSLWQHRFYYLFGFLFIVLVVLVVTSEESSREPG